MAQEKINTFWAWFMDGIDAEATHVAVHSGMSMEAVERLFSADPEYLGITREGENLPVYAPAEMAA